MYLWAILIVIKADGFMAIVLSAVHKNKHTSKVLAGITESIATPLCSFFTDKVNILKRIATLWLSDTRGGLALLCESWDLPLFIHVPFLGNKRVLFSLGNWLLRDDNRDFEMLATYLISSSSSLPRRQLFEEFGTEKYCIYYNLISSNS